MVIYNLGTVINTMLIGTINTINTIYWYYTNFIINMLLKTENKTQCLIFIKKGINLGYLCDQNLRKEN